jgi:Fic family protein
MAAKHLFRAQQWIWQAPEWPEFTWETERIAAPLQRARRAQGEILGASRMLDEESNLATQLEVLTREGLTTSAIEGEQLDPQSVRSSIARRLGLPTAGMPNPSRSVEGLVEILLDATQRYREPLTLKRLNAWQAALFPTGRSGLHEIRVGKLRGKEPMRIVSGPIGRERVHYEAPPYKGLSRQMKTFVEWFNNPPESLDGLLRAGIAHAWFEIIHPFEDGNGRVGRAVLDMALAQDEQRSTRFYSMSSRFMEVRDEYYSELERASSGTLNVTDWLVWFLEQTEAAARINGSVVETVLQKARFWLRHASNQLNERQIKALKRMLDAGPNGFEGGMTNKKYARLTKTSPATAQRDLSDLVEKQCLDLIGTGRAVHYELKIR